MLLHVGLLVEALAAVGARVRARVAVDEQMRGQGAGALEGLAALLALKPGVWKTNPLNSNSRTNSSREKNKRHLTPLFSFLRGKNTSPTCYPLLIITYTQP